MKNKKLLSVGLVFLLTFSLLLGCAKSENTTITETSITAETSAANDLATKDLATSDHSLPETDISADDEVIQTYDEVFEADPSIDEYSDEIKLPDGMAGITFSGDEARHYVSDNYGVYVSDRFIVLVDKNMDLPGDYGIMLEDIAEAIEQVSGLSFRTTRKAYTHNMAVTRSRERPWEDLKSGDKYIIQLNKTNDEKNIYLPASFYPGYAVLSDCGVYSVEPGEHVWPCDYTRLIDVLSLAITYNYYPQTGGKYEISEAIYYNTVEYLKEAYPDLKRMTLNMDFEQFRDDVTAENVEECWVKTCTKWNSRSERATFERLFVQFMLEKFGPEFLPVILTDNYAKRDMERKEMADRIKASFGKDVFVKYYEWAKEKGPERPSEVFFSGKASDTIKAKENCYAEGERCFLYIEAGLTVPGDFLKKADTIVAALEKKMWQSDTGLNYNYYPYGAFYGITNNKKLPILLKNDEDRMGFISYYAEEVNIYDSGMMSGNIHDIEYDTLAHESSHAVFDAKAPIRKHGKIMVEGSADYYAEYVLSATGIGDFNEYGKYYYYETPINKDTAETLFLNDFRNLSHAERGPEYTFGYYLTRYLDETYGDEFLANLNNAVKKSNIVDDGDYGDEKASETRVEIFKNLFGNDVFTKFGEWYTKNF